MRKLISNSKIMCGIFRAIVLEAWDTEASLYIPALHRTQMPFAIDESGTITGLANGESLDVLNHTNTRSTTTPVDNSSLPDSSEETDGENTEENDSTENPDEDDNNDSDEENTPETQDTEPEDDKEETEENEDSDEEESSSSASVNPSKPIVLTDMAGNKLAMQLKDFPKAQLSCWIGRSTVKPGMPLWIAFENEDSEFPIILGTLGSTLEYGELGSLLGGGGDGSSALSGVGFNGEYYEGLPTYTLSEEAITDIATMITGETGGEDVLACKQEASQLANLNEVRKNRSNTEEDILATLHCGWYASSSWSRGCTETAKSAVRTCLVDGKRVLPRYVTEHDMFPGDILNAKNRSEYQKGDNVSNRYGADYKFYCFFGTSEDGDISGYYPEDYEKYKDDGTRGVSIANASGVVAAAIQWATETANSKTIGYSQDQDKRWGPHFYDCSAFVISAYDAAGLTLKSSGATYTGNMVQVMLNSGFEDVTSQIILSSGKGLQPGDVLWVSGHTEMMVDSTHRAGAHTSNRALADQVSVEDYYNHPWSKVLRYTQK